MNTLKNKKVKIINYIKNECGGAVEFHTLGNLCLSVNEKGELCYVAFCKTSKKNPFGVIDKKYTLNDKTADKILSIINSKA